VSFTINTEVNGIAVEQHREQSFRLISGVAGKGKRGCKMFPRGL
jgi:hypothetical protein